MSGWNESFWFPLLLGGALKSATVLGAAWVIAVMLKRGSAASRRLIWTSAFVALLALPFISVSLPALRVPIGPALEPASVVFQVAAVDRAETPAQPAGFARAAAAHPPAGARVNWRLLVVLVWAAGAAISAAQVLAGWTAMWRVRRRARPASIPEIHALASIAGIDPPMVLETRGAADMPMTFGALHPAIFVPAGFSEWSESRRSAVLLHEIAHLRSGDPLTHLMARTALCLYWWNPLAWT
jgi:beta-lactamase regulating signal transducer with metallopeptidase domain